MALSRADRLKRVDGGLTPPAVAAGRVIAALARRTPSAAPLLVRPGGMGDLIALQIACEELAIDPRGAQWLVERRSASWARRAGLPHVTFDERPLRALRATAGRHRVVVNTEQRFGLSHAAAAAARAHGGATFAPSTNLAARWADVVVPYDPYDEHETVAFARLLAAALGGEPPERAPVRERRRPDDGHVVAAVSGLQSETRALPPGAFAEAVVAEAAGAPVRVTAAPIDLAYAQELLRLLPAGTELFRGDFDGVCDVIATAARLVAVDGGPVHIASYYGVPATAIFTSGRFAKWAPLGAGSRIIRRHGLACQPCTLFGQTPPCPNGLACLELGGRPAEPVA